MNKSKINKIKFEKYSFIISVQISALLNQK